jgi:hypothetical protein
MLTHILPGGSSRYVGFFLACYSGILMTLFVRLPVIKKIFSDFYVSFHLQSYCFF